MAAARSMLSQASERAAASTLQQSASGLGLAIPPGMLADLAADDPETHRAAAQGPGQADAIWPEHLPALRAFSLCLGQRLPNGSLCIRAADTTVATLRLRPRQHARVLRDVMQMSQALPD